MKLIIIILSSIFINACGGTKDLSSNTIVPVQADIESEKMLENDMINKSIHMLEYTANSRGSHILVRITEKFINYKLNRNDELLAIPNTKENWSELMTLMANIDLKQIPNLDPPSQAHQYDGAAHANFSVHQTKELKPLKTPTFDAGNPPKAIASIVEKMLSLIPSKN